MTDTTRLALQPEVADFVARVRSHLGDLSDEEREELVGGLEGDLSDLVVDGGTLAGLDPAAYASELRSAAGLEARRGRRIALPRRSPSRPLPEQTTELLDGARTGWDRLVARIRFGEQGWEVARVLRPGWWVLRAWIAVELVDIWAGPPEYLTPVPSLAVPGLGLLLLAAAVVGSALLGIRRMRLEDADESVPERVGLLALNLIALAVLPVVLGSFTDAWDAHALKNGEYASQFASGSPDRPVGLRNGGHYVRNIFAYDADGKPLLGVQLYDASGRPLAVSTDRYLGTYRGTGGGAKATYPWFNGDQPLWNVFPLLVREQGAPRGADLSPVERPPVLPTAPLAVVPPASMPTASVRATLTPSVTMSRAAGSGGSADSGKRPGR